MICFVKQHETAGLAFHLSLRCIEGTSETGCVDWQWQRALLQLLL
jgi:hypothetical protein